MFFVEGEEEKDFFFSLIPSRIFNHFFFILLKRNFYSEQFFIIWKVFDVRWWRNFFSLFGLSSVEENFMFIFLKWNEKKFSLRQGVVIVFSSCFVDDCVKWEKFSIYHFCLRIFFSFFGKWKISLHYFKSCVKAKNSERRKSKRSAKNNKNNVKCE